MTPTDLDTISYSPLRSPARSKLELTPTSSDVDERHRGFRLLLSRDSLILVCALLIAHAPLIVNNGFYADDARFLQIRPGQSVQTGVLMDSAGNPLAYAYCALANLTGHPIGFMKLLTLVAIAVGALNLRAFLTRLQILSGFETLILSFLVWSYSGYQAWPVRITATYTGSFALVCLGLNIFAALAGRSRPPIWVRLCGLVAVFGSFAINSMIVVYFAGLFATLSLVKAEGPRNEQKTSARLIASMRRFGDFLVVPFVYWIWITFFFPKLEPYKSYYQIKAPDVAETLALMERFLRWGVSQPIVEAANLARQSLLPPAVSLGVAIGLVALAARQNSSSKIRRPKNLTFAIWPVIAGIFIFVVWTSPYIAANVAPTGHYFESRHLILFGIPFGLILIGASRVGNSIRNGKIGGYVLCTLGIWINICALWSGYFDLQARSLRQTALTAELRQEYPAPPAAVFDLVDGFIGTGTHTYFGVIEITETLHQAWDERPLFGFTGQSERPTILEEMEKLSKTDGSAFRNIEPWGPQATINFTPRQPMLTNFGLSMKYYRCLIRFCDRRSVIDPIADTVVHVGPIPNLAPRPRPD